MKITMTQIPQVPVGKYGSSNAAWFEVRDQDETLRGQLHVSQGGVEWKRANAKQGNWLSWDTFVAKLEEEPMGKVQADPTGKCWCGCGAKTNPGRFFVSPHDAKAYGCLRKRFEGNHGNDGLANILLTLGFDDDNGVCPPPQKDQ